MGLGSWGGGGGAAEGSARAKAKRPEGQSALRDRRMGTRRGRAGPEGYARVRLLKVVTPTTLLCAPALPRRLQPCSRLWTFHSFSLTETECLCLLKIHILRPNPQCAFGGGACAG